VKKFELGQAITILANLGVIAGIAFLAVELQQNNALLEAQVQAYRFETLRGLANGIAANTDLAEAMAKIEANEPLTGTQEALVRATAMNLFRSWQWQYTEWREGRLPDENLSASRLMWTNAIQGEGIFRWPVGDYWNSMKSQFPADFVQFIEENVIAK